MKIFRILIVFFSLLLFSIICYFVCRYDVLKIDTYVSDFVINNIINNKFTSMCKVITQLGGNSFIILVSVLIFIFWKERWFVTFDLVGVVALNQVIKFIVKRPRPNFYRLVNASGYSFPSGHSMVGIAFYGIMVYLIYKNIKDNNLKYALIILLGLLIILIGFSRIYVGVHYFTDVIAGLLLGLAYLIVYIWIYKRVNKNEE